MEPFVILYRFLSDIFGVKVWVFWEGHKIWQERRVLCAQQRTCQKVDKDFSKQMWLSHIIQILRAVLSDSGQNIKIQPLTSMTSKGHTENFKSISWDNFVFLIGDKTGFSFFRVSLLVVKSVHQFDISWNFWRNYRQFSAYKVL